MTTPSPRVEDAPEDLLRRFRAAGDAALLGALFDATAPTLLRVALSIAPDAASAENALQETFLAVLETPERWDETRPVMPWLLGILHHQIGKVRRDGARKPDPLRLAPPLAECDPADAAVSREELERARAAIDALPEPYRAVAVLRWRHGLDPADIADVRGEPPGTTRSLLSRALEKLRERLGGTALTLFGVQHTRGLAGIRRAVIGKATAAAPVAVAGTVGVIVMKKIVAAALAVVLVAGATWWTAAQFADVSRDSAETETAVAPQSRATAERKRTRAADVPVAPGVELPPPVDLDKCDRDLDLFGRVVDEEGAPVAGANVTTSSYPWRGVGEVPSDLSAETAEGPATRTARDGTFAVRLSRGGMVDLRIAAEGFGNLIREQCSAGERVTMTMRRGATMAVTCVDEAGVPVPGVRARLSRSKKFDPVIQQREGLTDARGVVTFEGLTPGASTLRLDHATLGQPDWKQETIPATGTLALRVTMPAGRTVRGRVTDAASGAPVRGARVGLPRGLGPPVLTDADGRYAFLGWTGNGTSVLTAVADGYGGGQVAVPPAGDVDFALSGGDSIVGRLVGADGSPIAGGLVSASGWREGFASDSVGVRTDAGGHFELASLQHAYAHMLTAAAPGTGQVCLDIAPPAEPRGTVDLGDIVLPATRTIEGLATDGDDRPLADVLIQLIGTSDFDEPAARGDAPRKARISSMRRSDDLGRFRFVDVAPGTYELHHFTGDSPKTEPVRVTLPADRDLTDVRVKFAGGRSVTLFVVDDAGNPIPGIDYQGYGNFGQVGNSITHLWGATGPDGRATFRGLPAGNTTFSVCNTLSESRFLQQKVGPLVPDGQEVRVTLQRAAMIRGIVRDQNGAPVSGLIVTASLHRDGSDAGVGFGGESGAFSIKVAAGEIVDLVIDGQQSFHGDGKSGSQSTAWRGRRDAVTAPADGVTISVTEGTDIADRTMEIVVRDSTGATVPGMHVRVESQTPTTDAEGRARFEGLPRKRVFVSFSPGPTQARPRVLDIQPASFEVLPAGQEVVVNFRAGVRIHGRIVDAAGGPVSGATVSVETHDGVSCGVRADADGRFETTGLPRLAHRLTARATVEGHEVAGVLEGVIPEDAEVTIKAVPKSD